MGSIWARLFGNRSEGGYNRVGSQRDCILHGRISEESGATAKGYRESGHGTWQISSFEFSVYPFQSANRSTYGSSMFSSQSTAGRFPVFGQGIANDTIFADMRWTIDTLSNLPPMSSGAISLLINTSEMSGRLYPGPLRLGSSFSGPRLVSPDRSLMYNVSLT